MKKISVIGAGAWGSALAHVFAQAGHAVTLYARDADLAQRINDQHVNDLYLPQCVLYPSISATASLADAVQEADLIIMAVPAQHFRAVLEQVVLQVKPRVPVVNSAKGIEVASGALLSEVAQEIAPNHPYFVLSGPTFAAEVASGLPTAVTLAGKSDVASLAQELSCNKFKIYYTQDVIGAEIAGALKNVIAIACGIADGAKLGHNARAALMTRGMAEIRRYVMARGGDAQTLLGLAGIGDLSLTCGSLLSRNYSLGVALGEGKSLEQILGSRRAVTEGVTTVLAMNKLARKEGLDMPITSAVQAILHEGLSVQKALDDLMARPIVQESV